MQSTLEIVLPIFALILCGYLVGRARFISPEGMKGLSAFVYYIAVPALLFRTMARNVWDQAPDPDILFAYFGGTGLIYLATVWLGRPLFATSLQERAMTGMGTTFGNTVLLGIPLVFTAFGEAGALPLTLIIAFHSTLLLSLVSIFVELGRGGRAGWRALPVTVAKGLAGNPVILALLAGFLYSLTGWPLPGPFDSFTSLLSGAAAPCALIALGASMVGYRIGGDLKETLFVVAVKLILHPLVVALLAFYLFDLPPLWAAVAVVTAALPTGVNLFIFAQHYNIYLQRAPSIVLISTALSVISVSVLIALLAPT